MSETSENENKTEQDYLELGDCFKEIVNDKEKQIVKLQVQYIQCFKLMMMSYTFFRMFDILLSKINFNDPVLDNVIMNIEFIRGEISEYLDEINNVEDEDEYE